MENIPQQFIEFAINHKVLRFGNFTLKSGRSSPYFFNAGLFNTGMALEQLGQFYAQTILANQLEYDLLFGPAYKGIPLVSSAAICLSRLTGNAVPYAYNRKEVKDHGEGGVLVGAPIAGQTLLIDDVLTAGTALTQAIKLLQSKQGQVTGVVVAFDRKERGLLGQGSASEELAEQHGITITPIITIDNVLDYLQQRPDLADNLAAITEYRQRYGTSSL